MSDKKYILTAATADKKLRRIALEVAERNYNENELVLIGIKENGIFIAKKIYAYLKEVFKGQIVLTEISLNKSKPEEITIAENIDFTNKVVVLIDDVANSGKTMLYALKPLLQTYPKKIQTLALVERSHKSFPIDMDYIGLSISTTLDEHIYVEVKDGEIEGAWMK